MYLTPLRRRFGTSLLAEGELLTRASKQSSALLCAQPPVHKFVWSTSNCMHAVDRATGYLHNSPRR